MKPMRSKRFIAIAALTVAAAGAAGAQQGISALKGHDSRAPVDISADRGEAQDVAKERAGGVRVFGIQEGVDAGDHERSRA